MGWEGFRAGSLGEKGASKAGDSVNRMTLVAFGGCLVDRPPDDEDVTFDEGVEEDMVMARSREGRRQFCGVVGGRDRRKWWIYSRWARESPRTQYWRLRQA